MPSGVIAIVLAVFAVKSLTAVQRELVFSTRVHGVRLKCFKNEVSRQSVAATSRLACSVACINMPACVRYNVYPAQHACLLFTEPFRDCSPHNAVVDANCQAFQIKDSHECPDGTWYMHGSEKCLKLLLITVPASGAWPACLAHDLTPVTFDNFCDLKELETLPEFSDLVLRGSVILWTAGYWQSSTSKMWVLNSTHKEPTPLTPSMWTTGQPDYVGSYPFCINTFFSLDRSAFGLNDDNCGKLFSVLCQTSPH